MMQVVGAFEAGNRGKWLGRLKHVVGAVGTSQAIETGGAGGGKGCYRWLGRFVQVVRDVDSSCPVPNPSNPIFTL